MSKSSQVLAKSAIVIGAGLAGANIAERLASRNWRVDVIESGSAPAQGASGNPAGIVLPQIARDDALAARFSRACYLYLLSRLSEFPECQWDPCGVFQIARDSAHETLQQAGVRELKLPDNFVEFLPRDRAEKLVGQTLAHGGWWFAQGGWLAPASLCANLLARFPKNLRCHINARVTRIQRDGEVWIAYAANDQIIAKATHLVLANAHAANDLLEHALPLNVIRGQISYLPAKSLPPLKVVLCRNGYLTPAHDGQVTFGASFVNDDNDLSLRWSEHQGNFERLHEILPELDRDRLAAETKTMDGRVALRVATPDRLPLVGAIPAKEDSKIRAPTLGNLPRVPNLHALLGLSARGIVWAPLVAEHLACLMNHESSPLAFDIANAIDAGRYCLKDSRRR